MIGLLSQHTQYCPTLYTHCLIVCSEATDSIDSLASDEEVSVGDEEEAGLRIDWDG